MHERPKPLGPEKLLPPPHDTEATKAPTRAQPNAAVCFIDQDLHQARRSRAKRSQPVTRARRCLHVLTAVLVVKVRGGRLRKRPNLLSQLTRVVGAPTGAPWRSTVQL